MLTPNSLNRLRDSLRRLAGTAGAALPQSASIVARWSADAIPAQADGTALASWTDSVGGIAATGASGKQPTYKAAGQNGKPYVLFNGSQVLDAGTTGAHATALQGQHTAMVVGRNMGANTAGTLLSAADTTAYLLYMNGGTGAGQWASAGQRTPYTGTGLTTLAYVTAIGVDTAVARVFINGTCPGAAGVCKGVAGKNVTIGAKYASGTTNVDGLYGYKGEIYEVIIWNRVLSAAEVMQAEKWVRDKYASAYPWAGGPFRVFHGDSITNGLAASGPLTNYPGRVAAANGWAFGQWTNLGHVGACWNNSPSGFNLNTESLTDIDPMVALLGATPLHVMAWEYFNQGKGQTAASVVYNGAIAYLQARKAAGVAKLFFGSSVDSSDAAAGYTESVRQAYNAWCDANAAGYCDRYVPFHNDANIGVAEACPNSSPYTPYFNTDGIHLIDAGYQLLANIVAPAMA